MVSKGGIGFVNKAKPYLAVVFMQFTFAGLNLITKLALNKGMSPHTLAVYRNAVAAAALAPFAIVLERPVVDQNLYAIGMQYTTATFTLAMTNAVPCFTFVLAWILRMEKVNLREKRSRAKVAGTLAALVGAMVMALYKGACLIGKEHHQLAQMTVAKDRMAAGSAALIVACCCWAGYIILQAITLGNYPAELSLAALICLLGSIQGAVVAVAVEYKSPASWFIGCDVRLLVILYAGIRSGITYYLQGVIMKQKGPVFVTAFSPSSMVIVVVLGSLFLAEEVYLGSMMGAVIIVVGLYFLVWGMMESQSPSSPSPEDQEEVVVVVQLHNQIMILPSQASNSEELVTIDNL